MAHETPPDPVSPDLAKWKVLFLNLHVHLSPVHHPQVKCPPISTDPPYTLFYLPHPTFSVGIPLLLSVSMSFYFFSVTLSPFSLSPTTHVGVNFTQLSGTLMHYVLSHYYGIKICWKIVWKMPLTVHILTLIINRDYSFHFFLIPNSTYLMPLVTTEAIAV